MFSQKRRVVALLFLAVWAISIFPQTAAAHGDPMGKPLVKVDSGLVFWGLGQESQRLQETLRLENYDVTTATQQSLERVEKAVRQGAKTPEMQEQLVSDYQSVLDQLMQTSETIRVRVEEPSWRFLSVKPRLRVEQAPRLLHLTANVKRQIPVILDNVTSQPVRVKWSGEGSGEVTAFAHSHTRFFTTIMAVEGAQAAGVSFELDGRAITAEGPVEMKPSGKVLVEIFDEEGDPTACRLYVTASDGKPYAPEGAVKRLTDMGERYYHVPGRFSLTLPAGPAKLEFVKGFEYLVKTMDINVGEGQEAQCMMGLGKWTDVRQQGWFSGDGHIHMSYGGSLQVKPQDVMRMLEAEDVNVGNMVTANVWGDDVQDREWFTGKVSTLSTPNHIMRWGEEYRNDLFGHLILYNLTRLTYPIYSGFARSKSHAHDFPLNADIADQALGQGGFVTGAHPSWGSSEHVIDVALGKMGGLEIAGYGAFIPGGVSTLHALWNCGFRTAATAGTDSFLNVVQRDPLGGARCYAKVNGTLSYASWVEAVKAGRTFATNGPMLFLQVSGQEPGAEIRTGVPDTTATLTARAVSQWPLGELTVYYNGKPIGSVRGQRGEHELVLEGPIRLSQSGWIAAECSGPSNRFVFGGSLFKGQAQFAHTSPVWVDVAGQLAPPTADAARLVEWIDGFARKVEKEGKFANGQQRQRMRQVFSAARAKYAALAARYEESYATTQTQTLIPLTEQPAPLAPQPSVVPQGLPTGTQPSQPVEKGR